jgi:hypothetical protein
MSHATVGINHALGLAKGAQVAYALKLRGLPDAISDAELEEHAHIVQKGVNSSGILTTEKQRKSSHAILGEENMRRGLEKLIERAGEQSDFFDYVKGTGIESINLSFTDYVFLANAARVTAEDFR